MQQTALACRRLTAFVTGGGGAQAQTPDCETPSRLINQQPCLEICCFCSIPRTIIGCIVCGAKVKYAARLAEYSACANVQDIHRVFA